VTPTSGRTVRHRLNRGGDRALNRAIHTIAIEGKTPKEIRRCLKRYIARELYRTLTATITPTDHPALPIDKSVLMSRWGAARA
jgi:transposase